MEKWGVLFCLCVNFRVFGRREEKRELNELYVMYEEEDHLMSLVWCLNYLMCVCVSCLMSLIWPYYLGKLKNKHIHKIEINSWFTIVDNGLDVLKQGKPISLNYHLSLSYHTHTMLLSVLYVFTISFPLFLFFFWLTSHTFHFHYLSTILSLLFNLTFSLFKLNFYPNWLILIFMQENEYIWICF